MEKNISYLDRILAVSAIILASTSLLIQLLSYLSDSPKIKVDIDDRLLLLTTDEEYKGENISIIYATAKISNLGKQAASIVDFKIKILQNGKEMPTIIFQKVDLPLKVEAGESIYPALGVVLSDSNPHIDFLKLNEETKYIIILEDNYGEKYIKQLSDKHFIVRKQSDAKLLHELYK